MELLAHDDKAQEQTEESIASRITWKYEKGKQNEPDRPSNSVYIIGKFSLGDRPRSPVVALKCIYLRTENGRLGITVIVYSPMINSSSQVCKDVSGYDSEANAQFVVYTLCS